MSVTYQDIINEFEQTMHDVTLNLGNTRLGYESAAETTSREEYIDTLEYLSGYFADMAEQIRNLNA